MRSVDGTKIYETIGLCLLNEFSVLFRKRELSTFSGQWACSYKQL